MTELEDIINDRDLLQMPEQCQSCRYEVNRKLWFRWCWKRPGPFPHGKTLLGVCPDYYPTRELWERYFESPYPESYARRDRGETGGE